MAVTIGLLIYLGIDATAKHWKLRGGSAADFRA